MRAATVVCRYQTTTRAADSAASAQATADERRGREPAASSPRSVRERARRRRTVRPRARDADPQSGAPQDPPAAPARRSGSACTSTERGHVTGQDAGEQRQPRRIHGCSEKCRRSTVAGSTARGQQPLEEHEHRRDGHAGEQLADHEACGRALRRPRAALASAMRSRTAGPASKRDGRRRRHAAEQQQRARRRRAAELDGQRAARTISDRRRRARAPIAVARRNSAALLALARRSSTGPISSSSVMPSDPEHGGDDVAPPRVRAPLDVVRRHRHLDQRLATRRVKQEGVLARLDHRPLPIASAATRGRAASEHVFAGA